MRRVAGEEDDCRFYKSFDRGQTPMNTSTEEDDLPMAAILEQEDLANFESTSVPIANLKLRPGDICLLLLTLDKIAGLVKNVRVKVVNCLRHRVIVQLPNGRIHSIPRCKFAFKPSYRLRGIEIERRQFPLTLAYAITVHKSQGQTLGRVLYDARTVFFTHGQAYVAFSRVADRHSFAAVVDKTCLDKNNNLVVVNIVYDELLARLKVAGG
jgi:hypothetical protein